MYQLQVELNYRKIELVLILYKKQLWDLNDKVWKVVFQIV